MVKTMLSNGSLLQYCINESYMHIRDTYTGYLYTHQALHHSVQPITRHLHHNKAFPVKNVLASVITIERPVSIMLIGFSILWYDYHHVKFRSMNKFTNTISLLATAYGSGVRGSAACILARCSVQLKRLRQSVGFIRVVVTYCTHRQLYIHLTHINCATTTAISSLQLSVGQ